MDARPTPYPATPPGPHRPRAGLLELVAPRPRRSRSSWTEAHDGRPGDRRDLLSTNSPRRARYPGGEGAGGYPARAVVGHVLRGATLLGGAIDGGANPYRSSSVSVTSAGWPAAVSVVYAGCLASRVTDVRSRSTAASGNCWAPSSSLSSSARRLTAHLAPCTCSGGCRPPPLVRVQDGPGGAGSSAEQMTGRPPRRRPRRFLSRSVGRRHDLWGRRAWPGRRSPSRTSSSTLHRAGRLTVEGDSGTGKHVSSRSFRPRGRVQLGQA